VNASKPLLSRTFLIQIHALTVNYNIRLNMSSTSDDDNTRGPQEELNEFWESLITKKPCKVTNIFPSSLYANLLPPEHQIGPEKGKNAAESYEAAAKECRARVQQIIRECHRTNEKVIGPCMKSVRGQLADGLSSPIQSLISKMICE
jgi:hypothetical protein